MNMYGNEISSEYIVLGIIGIAILIYAIYAINKFMKKTKEIRGANAAEKSTDILAEKKEECTEEEFNEEIANDLGVLKDDELNYAIELQEKDDQEKTEQRANTEREEKAVE